MHRAAILWLVLVAGCATAPRVPTETVRPTGERVRLLVIGDSGIYDATYAGCAPGGPNETPVIPFLCRERLLMTMRAERADLVLDLGDLVYEYGPVCPRGRLTRRAERLFDGLIGNLQELVGTRLVLALGNHDVHHRRGYPAAEACYLAYAKKHADRISLPDRNFVLDVGVAKIAVLDTNQPPGPTVTAALQAALREPRPWLLMAAHHVWRTYGDKPDERHGEEWARYLGRDPDMWLNGHAHFLQFGVYPGAVDPGREVAALTSGAAGKLRPQPECTHPDAGVAQQTACAPAGELFGRSNYGYAVVDLTATQVRVVFKDLQGTPMFAWERTRGDPAGRVLAVADLR
jgi:hypothetical protein